MAITITTIGEQEFASAHEGRHYKLALLDAIDDIADRIHEVAVLRAPHGKTGMLKSEGIGKTGARPTTTNVFKAYVGIRRLPEHGVFVHEGTGLLGPKHKPIFAPGGNVMKFRGRTGLPVYARSTRGQKPQPFLREALELVADTYIPGRLAALARGH